MSVGNVDRVWAVFIAYRERRIFEMLELLHRDVVWVRPGPTEYHGHDGVRQMLRELQEATGGYSVRLDDVTEAEPGVVIAKGQVTPTGKAFGTDVTWTATLVSGLITRVETRFPWPTPAA